MYAKIFRQIYEGTLCTNGPWQALVTFQQLLILADPEGNVDMTIKAIARITTIPCEILELGIKSLLEPDTESRTPDQDGKRIIPLCPGRIWGWKIVNYMRYRELKREEDRREYHREYWHKRKDKLNKPQHHSTDSTKSTEEVDRGSKTLVHFEAFWQAYPRKINKPATTRAWIKAKLENGNFDLIMQALTKQIESASWRKSNGQFIPYPATWINGHRWEDEITTKPEQRFVV